MVDDSRNEWIAAGRFVRRHPVVSAELLVVFCVVVASLTASSWLGDPNYGELTDSLVGPLTAGHPLGADLQGRDILVRIVYGLRTSVLISVTATCAALVLGLVMGLLAGLVGWLDVPIMRLVDIQLAFPALVLALAVVAALGGASTVNVMVVLILTGWVSYARVCRAMVMSLRGALFVDGARVAGATPMRIAAHHLAPNVLPTLVAMAVAQFPMMMIQEASLSYLGLGVPSSTPTLGVMMQEGQSTLFSAWWPAVAPAVAMALVVLMLSSLGDFASRTLNRT